MPIMEQSNPRLPGSRIGQEGTSSDTAQRVSGTDVITATLALNAPMDGGRTETDQTIILSSNESDEKDTGLGGEDATGIAVESESEDEEEEKTTAKKKVSERRRAQNVKFSSWYASRIRDSE